MAYTNIYINTIMMLNTLFILYMCVCVCIVIILIRNKRHRHRLKLIYKI
jgi:hypothetical protein